MEPIDVYLMYCAMKAHFSKSNYDYVKYDGRPKFPEIPFGNARTGTSLSRYQRSMMTQKTTSSQILSEIAKGTLLTLVMRTTSHGN